MQRSKAILFPAVPKIEIKDINILAYQLSLFREIFEKQQAIAKAQSNNELATLLHELDMDCDVVSLWLTLGTGKEDTIQRIANIKKNGDLLAKHNSPLAGKLTTWLTDYEHTINPSKEALAAIKAEREKSVARFRRESTAFANAQRKKEEDEEFSADDDRFKFGLENTLLRR